jgi:hypothetical protein
MTSTVLLKHGKYDVVDVCGPKETILKEMAAKIECVKTEVLPSAGTFR